jgi:alpha-tubulin suppressor-like RCC1 family protein
MATTRRPRRRSRLAALVAGLAVLALAAAPVVALSPSASAASTAAFFIAIDPTTARVQPTASTVRLSGIIGSFTTDIAPVEPLVLQRQVGAAWTDVASLKTSRKGSFSFAFASPPTAGTWRMRILRLGHGATPTVAGSTFPLVFVASRFHVMATLPARVVNEGPAVAAVRFTPRVSALVSLEEYSQGEWHALGTVWAKSGTAQVSAVLPMGAHPRLRVDVQATATVAGGLSGPLSTTVVEPPAVAGHVWALGNNYYRELGDGSHTPQYVAAPLLGLSGVTSVVAGDSFVYALRGDGTVWAWGRDYKGQLGDGALAERPLPQRIRGLSHVVDLAANFYVGYAVEADGSVWSWGQPDPTNTTAAPGGHPLRPTRLAGLSGVRQIATGYGTYALLKDGTVLAWGSNFDGDLGIGVVPPVPADPNASANDEVTTPTPVPGLDHVRSIDTSYGTTHVIRTDGTAWGWGNNGNGQVGDGTTGDDVTAPAQVVGLQHVVSMADGPAAYAATADGSAWSWGGKGDGALGRTGVHGRTSPRPVRIPGLHGVTQVAAGEFTAYAVATGGTVWAWGSGLYGTLGRGYNLGNSSGTQVTPRQVLDLKRVTQVSGGTMDTYLLQG